MKLRALSLALLALSALFTSGCATFRASYMPTSSRTYEQAVAAAERVIQDDTSLRAVQVSDTGSMKPYLGESAIVILEPALAGQIKKGMVVAHNDGALEKIHLVVGVRQDGVFTRAATGGRRTFVPWTDLTGRAFAVFYFNPKTARVAGQQQDLPTAFASVGDVAPAAPVLQILSAQMLSTGPSAALVMNSPGAYRLTLPKDASIRLFVGAAGAAIERASVVDVDWNTAASMPRVKINDPSNPSLGAIDLELQTN